MTATIVSALGGVVVGFLIGGYWEYVKQHSSDRD